MGRVRNSYNAEFKQDSSKLLLFISKSIKLIAEDRNVSPSGLKSWIDKAKTNEGLGTPSGAGNFSFGFRKKK